MQNKNSNNILILIITILIQNSSQQVIINKSSTVEGICTYSYDSQNRYSCELSRVNILNPTDTLVITGTHLEGHTDGSVQALTHNTQSVSFSRFNGEALRKFFNLRFIDLRRVRIEEINANAFEVCGQLEELQMGQHFWLRTLPQGMLRNCGNLRVFSDFWSSFDALPADLFGATRNLEVFEAQSGLLSSFPDNLLQKMQNLRVFDVRSNRLTHMSQNNLVNVRNLQEFDIGMNHFSDAQAVMDLLSRHLGLRRIDISFTAFPMFSFDFFTQFLSLNDLAVSGSGPITQIAWQSLPNSLTRLSVHDVGEEIPENAFNRLVNLNFLSLYGSGITTLQKDTFVVQTNLQMLSLVQTRIATLHPELFINQNNLRSLILRENQISELPAGVFAPLVNLTLLSCLLNRIQRLPADSFGQHPNLLQIDFGANQINEIQRGIFSRFNPQMLSANFLSNRCISSSFSNAENLDQNRAFERCFNNFDGNTDGAENNFRKFEIFVILFIGFVKFLIDFC